MDKIYDVIILGGGPAGLSAGLYAGRSRLSTLIIEKGQDGGQIAITDEIENYPGQMVDGESGPELIARMTAQSVKFGAERVSDTIKEVSLEGEVKVLKGEKEEYKGKNVIIATGAHPRPIGCKGEREYLGKGVSYCATCDGAFFQDYPVAVVGGGDSAVKEALYLADIASRVYLIHRREGFRANQTAVDKMLANDKIELKLNKVVERIEGEGMMQTLTLQDVKTGEAESLQVEGLFVSIGLVAAADFIEGLLETEEGYIVTDKNMATSVPGIFAAGDIRVKTARQVATAVGDGALAGIAVTEYLKE